MFKLYAINFGYFLHTEYASLDDAREGAKHYGYEVSIYDPKGNMVGSWSPIGGYKKLVE
jgi:hypothetical protein